MRETNPLPVIFNAQPNLQKNQLLYGDNLTIMRTMPNACVDLIYLDPPFNSQRNYNLIYKKVIGQPVPEREEAFCDAWEMDAEKEEMARKMPIVLRDYGVGEDLVMFWKAWIDALRHTQPRLLAYLIYMSYRLFEMRRILKPTGSLYLHCDAIASHYLKVIMDSVFGHKSYRNEIVWQCIGAHNDPKRYGSISDRILFYTKSNKWTWNPQYTPYKPEYLLERYRHDDGDGRLYWRNTMNAPSHGRPVKSMNFRGEEKKPPIGTMWRFTQEQIDQLEKQGRIYYSNTGMPYIKSYLDERKRRPLQDVWTDIVMSKSGKERLAYPTQKPIALLKRIINVSTNQDDVVFDPFCRCGTAIYAAHLLGRKWLGCDIAILSVRLISDVLLKRYGLKEGIDYEVSGVPLSVEGAEDLFDRDPRQFQRWAVELAGGFVSTKTTGDEGINGRIHFEIEGGNLKNMILSVKGGKLSPAFMRELHGTIQRETDGTEMGGFICLQHPTKGMKEEAASAGCYTYLGKDYDRLQIRTIEDLLDGKGFDTPSKVPTLGWNNQIIMPI